MITKLLKLLPQFTIIFIKWVCIQIPAIIIGVLIAVPLGCAFTKDRKLKTTKHFSISFIDKYWGNWEDGISGDTRWYQEWVAKQNWFIRTFPTYWWNAIRNPIHNLQYILGIDDVLQDLEVSYTGSAPYRRGTTLTIATVTGKNYPMFYGIYKYPFTNHYFRLLIGYKCWVDQFTPFIGKEIKTVMAVSPLVWLKEEDAKP